MKSTLEEVVKQLPDFEEFMELAKEIRELSLRKLLIEKELKAKESEIFREATTNAKYFSNGKAPSTSYIESAFRFSGFNGELLKAREELAKITAELDYKKLTMDIYKNMVSIFQTISANERKSEF